MILDFRTPRSLYVVEATRLVALRRSRAGKRTRPPFASPSPLAEPAAGHLAEQAWRCPVLPGVATWTTEGRARSPARERNGHSTRVFRGPATQALPGVLPPACPLGPLCYLCHTAPTTFLYRLVVCIFPQTITFKRAGCRSRFLSCHPLYQYGQLYL